MPTPDLDQLCVDTNRTLAPNDPMWPDRERFAPRGEGDFQNRLLSAMRFGFGGHVVRK